MRELYHRIPREKDDAARAIKRAQTLIRFLPRRYSPKVYLDFGGADGQITAQLARLLRPKRAICADLTEWQNMHHNLSRDQSVEFVALTSSTLPFPNESIDFCTALQVLHHVPDQQQTIAELYRVLKPGGYLLVREHDCISKEVADRIDWVHYLYEIVVADKPNWEYLEHKAVYHSMAEWRDLFQAFQIVEVFPARDNDINRNAHILLYKR